MVKHIRMIAAVCTAAILTLVGCSNISDATVTGSGETTSVDFSIANKNGISALITPGAIKLTETTLYYKISGESETGIKYPAASGSGSAAVAAGTPEALTFTDNVATLTNIAVDDWNFTLWAYTDEACTNLVLKGTSKCSVKSSAANSVAFTLSSYGVTTKGSYTVAVKYTGSTSAWDATKYNLTWGLYDKTSGKLLTNAGATSATTLSENEVTIADSVAVTATAGYSITASDVAPGTYRLRIRIKSSGTELATKFDDLVVEPGRETTGTLSFGDIIATRPVAPETLQVQELVNSNFAPNDDFYTVRLYWPASTTSNEEAYQLLVKEFTNTSSAQETFALDATKESIVDKGYTLYKFDEILELAPYNNDFNIGYVAGSLYAGNTELVLRLPTGRMFDFQIRAENSIGQTAATARSASEDGELATASGTTTALLSTLLGSGYAGDVKGFGVSDAASPTFYKHVVVTQIKYALNGGTWKISASDSFAGTEFVDYVIYDKKYEAYTDSTTPSADNYIALKTINASTTSVYPQLVSASGVDFSKWTYSYNNSPINDIKYNILGYKNIVVTAIYGSTTGTVTINKSGITVDSLPAELASSVITIKYGDKELEENTTTYTSAGISVARGTGEKYITVYVSTDEAYAYYNLYINGTLKEKKDFAATSIRFTNFSTSMLTKGIENEIMVEAVTASGKYTTGSTTIKLTN